MLSTHPHAPVVPKAPVGSDLLQALEILAQFVVQQVGHDLARLAILDVLLPVEEPVWDLVLARVLHDGHDLVDLLISELTSTPESTKESYFNGEQSHLQDLDLHGSEDVTMKKKRKPRSIILHFRLPAVARILSGVAVLAVPGLLADLLLALSPVQRHVGLLEDEIGVSPPDSLDGGQGKHNVAPAIDVGVEHSKDVLKVGRDDQRHGDGVPICTITSRKERDGRKERDSCTRQELPRIVGANYICSLLMNTADVTRLANL